MKNTRRTLAIALVLCGLCRASFAIALLTLDAPQDDFSARAGVCDRPELKPWHDAYFDIITARLQPFESKEIEKIFSPKLGPVTNRTGTRVLKDPEDLVIPTFATGKGSRGMFNLMLSGVLIQPPLVNKRHVDLHAISNIGYVEFFYSWNGTNIENAVIYLRADEQFVPLKSTNDFPRRLEWEKVKFTALNKWFDEHYPHTDLGMVEVSTSGPNRIRVAGGKTLIVTARSVLPSKVIYIDIAKQTANKNDTNNVQPVEFLYAPGSPFSISVDGKFFRLTPKLVDKISKPVK